MSVNIRQSCAVCLTVLTGTLLPCTPVSGAIRNVPGDYATIQQAIDAAGNGDTPLVQDGIYAESVEFGFYPGKPRDIHHGALPERSGLDRH